jgi:hypothetical protein
VSVAKQKLGRQGPASTGKSESAQLKALGVCFQVVKFNEDLGEFITRLVRLYEQSFAKSAPRILTFRMEMESREGQKEKQDAVYLRGKRGEMRFVRKWWNGMCKPLIHKTKISKFTHEQSYSP